MGDTGKHIFSIENEHEFNGLCMEVFQLQAEQNAVYAEYLSLVNADPYAIHKPEQIPFLPIELFKTHRVITGTGSPAVVFESSGTTDQQPSKHFVISTELYQESLVENFRRTYGDPAQLCILALLPSYLERKNASLVYMMDHLVKLSGHPDSGFYLDDLEGLAQILKRRNEDGHPTLLLGVSFALLELAEKHPVSLNDNVTLMETGGMKGRRKEMIREELHAVLGNAFGKKTIHSEYGMTELLSQAYSAGKGIFTPPPWMKVLTRDLYDPKNLLPPGRSGGINIIDLANKWSCSFLAAADVGRTYQDGSFQITGRFDQAEIRGCNLMVV